MRNLLNKIKNKIIFFIPAKFRPFPKIPILIKPIGEKEKYLELYSESIKKNNLS